MLDIYDLVQNISTDWKDIILDYPHLKDIQTFIITENKIYGEAGIPTYPNEENIFRCFNYFNIGKTKAVILGQDPYHSCGEACGLCFGVEEKYKVPPSLRNIKQELQNDVGQELHDKSLEKWAGQGVLLLNTALTVRQKNPASHMKVWMPFTEYIINYLNNQRMNLVFIAWGQFAYDKLKKIKGRHTLIVSSHPSPLSARRMMGPFPAFLGSRPFSQVNKYIDGEIEW